MMSIRSHPAKFSRVHLITVTLPRDSLHWHARLPSGGYLLPFSSHYLASFGSARYLSKTLPDTNNKKRTCQTRPLKINILEIRT